MDALRYLMVAVVVGLTACAPTRQLINLTPAIAADGAAATADLSITLQVQDERSDPLLGRRGDITLYTEQNVAQLLHDALVPALAARRIQVTAGAGPRSLTVLIKSLKLESASGKWTAKAELGSGAQNGNAQYKANYRVEKDKKSLLNPGPGEVERVLNELLNEALLKLVNDAGLVAFLSK